MSLAELQAALHAGCYSTLGDREVLSDRLLLARMLAMGGERYDVPWYTIDHQQAEERAADGGEGYDTLAPHSPACSEMSKSRGSDLRTLLSVATADEIADLRRRLTQYTNRTALRRSSEVANDNESLLPRGEGRVSMWAVGHER